MPSARLWWEGRTGFFQHGCAIETVYYLVALIRYVTCKISVYNRLQSSYEACCISNCISKNFCPSKPLISKRFIRKGYVSLSAMMCSFTKAEKLSINRSSLAISSIFPDYMLWQEVFTCRRCLESPSNAVALSLSCLKKILQILWASLDGI